MKPQADNQATLARSLLTRLDHELLFGAERLPRPPSAPTDTLDSIALEISSCTLCSLSESRTRAVPGEGNPEARIVFVGEGPGHDEDIHGRPFVGRAGKLLDRMMAAINLDRHSAYIANVVKCRPPANRTPTPLESATCLWYLKRQLSLIRPAVVCALGTVAASALLERDLRITAVRGRRFNQPAFTLVPTYHPAFLLRNPTAKKEAWHDLQLIRRILDDVG